MLVVGSSSIAIGSTGTSEPAGTVHALDAVGGPVCGASRVAYVWPAIAWAMRPSADQGDQCPECIARTAAAAAAVPAQPSPPVREQALDRTAE